MRPLESLGLGLNSNVASGFSIYFEFLSNYFVCQIKANFLKMESFWTKNLWIFIINWSKSSFHTIFQKERSANVLFCNTIEHIALLVQLGV